MPSLQETSRSSRSREQGGEYSDLLGSADSHPTAIDRLLDRHGLADVTPASVPVRQRRITLVTRTIETQIVPMLAVAHRQQPHRQQQLPAPSEAELASFTALVLANDLKSSRQRIDELIARGATLPQICIDLLAPAARRLGEMWDDDVCSFFDVTAGLGTLQLLLHTVRGSFEPAIAAIDPARRILLASLSGEQHTFGLNMVAGLFDHSGWDVTTAPAAAEADLVKILADEWYAVVGLSIAGDEQAGPLALAIRAMRKASHNQAIGVLVGGPVFVARPELARLVGADVTASDAQQAVFRAEGLRVLMAAL